MTALTTKSRRSFRDLYRKLDYRFSNEELLNRALTPSTVDRRNNYELLEIFGDAAFYYISLLLLHERYPLAAESELTRMRGLLVTNANLALTALRLNLTNYLQFMGSSSAVDYTKIFADMVEALIAAVLEDGGLEEATAVCRRIFSVDLETARFDGPGNILVRKLKAKNDRRRISYHHYNVDDESPISRFMVTLRLGHEVVIDNCPGIDTKQANQRAAALALLKLFPDEFPRKYSIAWKLR